MAMLKQAAAAAQKSKSAAAPVEDKDQPDQQSDDQQDTPEPDDEAGDSQQPPDQDEDTDQETGDAADDSQGGDADEDQGSAGGDSDQGDSSGNGPLDQIQKPATPQMQKEFNRAVMALHTALYTSTKISSLVVKMVQPVQIVDSTSKCCILIINQLDRKLRLDPQVIPQFTMAVVDEVMDMIQKVKQVTYSPGQQKAILGAVFEGVMKMFGVPPQEAQQFLASLSNPQKSAARQQYVSDLNEAKQSSPSAAPGSAPENTPPSSGDDENAPASDGGDAGEPPSPDDEGAGAPDADSDAAQPNDSNAEQPQQDEGQ